MGFAQRRIMQRFEEEQKRVVKSFSKAGAYSMDRGIKETQIAGCNTAIGKSVIGTLVNKGIIKKMNGVCWMDFTAYEAYIKAKKHIAIVVTAAMLVFVAALIYFMYIGR
ncbi:MAG: hypothetical protein AB1Z23_12475 [Eubacteriales bacterium]